MRDRAGPDSSSGEFRRAKLLRRLWSIPATRAVVALAFVMGIGCLFNADGAFFNAGTHRDALRQASVFGILACGLTLVIISGGIDLAAGSLLALIAVAFSLTSIHWGWGWCVSIPACLMLGAACGGLSGGLPAGFRIRRAAQEQKGDPETGIGYELTAIAIVVIGGTSLTGGRGGIGLTLLGTLTIGYLEKILSINAVPEASRLMLTGAIIVIAVLAQSRSRH